MDVNAKKMAVLEILRQQGKPIALADLLGQLEPNSKERTVRRWLSELSDEGLVEKIGQKKSTRYLAISSGISDNFASSSRKAIEYVQQPIYNRKPVTYNEEWLERYIPNETTYTSLQIRNEFNRAGKRSKDNEPAGTYAHHIYTRLLIDLSYNSSRLEGNTYSLIDTQRLLIKGEGATDKLDEEKIMILNHKEAIRYLVEKAENIEVTKETTCTLHYLLTDGLVPAEHAGKVRNHGVRIGGSTYIPIEDPRRLELQLQKICAKGAKIHDPFEQSIFLLAHISYLQAFTDGNKRTARLSANIPLIKNNFVPFSFNDIKREDYASAVIAIYELNKVQPLVDLLHSSYLRTCQLYDATVEAMGFDQVRVKYRQQRREIIRHIITNKLIGKPMESYIVERSKYLIQENDLPAFLEDVREDLKEMCAERIAGLGITIDQMHAWLEMFIK